MRQLFQEIILHQRFADTITWRPELRKRLAIYIVVCIYETNLLGDVSVAVSISNRKYRSQTFV